MNKEDLLNNLKSKPYGNNEYTDSELERISDIIFYGLSFGGFNHKIVKTNEEFCMDIIGYMIERYIEDVELTRLCDEIIVDKKKRSRM